MKKITLWGLTTVLLLCVAGNVWAEDYTLRLKSPSTWGKLYLYLYDNSGSLSGIGAFPGAVINKDADNYYYYNYSNTGWVNAIISNKGPETSNGSDQVTLRNNDNNANAEVQQSAYQYWDWSSNSSWSVIYNSNRRWPQANSNTVPATIYLGDKDLNFSCEAWGQWADGKTGSNGTNRPGKGRMFIAQTKAGLATATPAAYSSSTTSNTKAVTSPQFTALGEWYWAIQVSYNSDDLLAWYARNMGSWADMI
ncbi:MAG: starch-binding protein, partial [Dysgonamonadaceae bacterium]|nr:starch-binding protein [Dysgonamonadaceae bacterium]